MAARSPRPSASPAPPPAAAEEPGQPSEEAAAEQPAAAEEPAAPPAAELPDEGEVLGALLVSELQLEQPQPGPTELPAQLALAETGFAGEETATQPAAELPGREAEVHQEETEPAQEAPDFEDFYLGQEKLAGEAAECHRGAAELVALLPPELALSSSDSELDHEVSASVGRDPATPEVSASGAAPDSGSGGALAPPPPESALPIPGLACGLARRASEPVSAPAEGPHLNLPMVHASEDAPPLGTRATEAAAPRFEESVLAELRSAGRVGDLEPRTAAMVQMRFKRALNGGRVPPEVAAAHAARRRDGKESLTLLLQWAEGKIRDVDPSVRERVRRSAAQETEHARGWFSWNELMQLHGGFQSKEQRKYVDSLWQGARRGGERPHPDAGGKPQRRFWVRTEELERWRKERSWDLQLEGAVDESTAGRQLLEALEAPLASSSAGTRALPKEPALEPAPKRARMESAAPSKGGKAGQRPSKVKRRAGSSSSEDGSEGESSPGATSSMAAACATLELPHISRTAMLGEIFKLSQRVVAMQDAHVPAEDDLAQLDPMPVLAKLLKQLLEGRASLEFSPQCTQECLRQVKRTVEAGAQTLKRLKDAKLVA